MKHKLTKAAFNASSTQHKSAKAAQFQDSESDSNQGKHLLSTDEASRRHMPAQRQRNAAQVSEGYFKI
jgi:hypothetical protein